MAHTDPSAEMFPASLSSVPQSRRYARRCAQDSTMDEDCLFTLELLTSEVMTNAVVHGRGPIGLSVVADAQHIRVEVTDQDSALPEMRDDSGLSTGGRGLHLVDAMAGAWGVDQLPGGAHGKTVWFTLP